MVEKILSVILRYGLEVFPLCSVVGGVCTCRNPSCTSPGKHPLLRVSWKAIATSDEGRIRDWFSRFDRLNYAVATGRKLKTNQKYLVVVDVDASEHPILSELTPTFSYRTGGGGYHFWYWADIPVRNSVAIVPKVDIRGTNGYVVIPPRGTGLVGCTRCMGICWR